MSRDLGCMCIWKAWASYEVFQRALPTCVNGTIIGWLTRISDEGQILEILKQV